MGKRILVVCLISLFVLFVFAGGALAAKKVKFRDKLPVDGAQPPPQYVGPSPVMYEGAKQPDCEDINPTMGYGYVIQHAQAGITYYDYQKNGSVGRMIAVGPAGHRHLIWHETRGPYGAAFPRYITYNCKDPSDVWLGTSYIDGGTGINAGYVNIDYFRATGFPGREVVIYHSTAETPDRATKLIIADEGLVCWGLFSNHYDLPDWMQNVEPGMWPKMGIVYDALVDTDYIHIVQTEGKTSGGNQRLGYIRCRLLANGNLLCETPTKQAGTVSPTIVSPNVPGCGSFCPIGWFGECEATGVPAGEYPNTIAPVVATSPVSKKVAIVFTNKRMSGETQTNNDVFYFESTNNGVEWFPPYPPGDWPPTEANGMLTNVTNFATSATERAYSDVAACYDYNDNLHIVFNSINYDSVLGGVATFNSNIYHWSSTSAPGWPANWTVVAAAQWDDGVIDPGAWNVILTKPSISAKDPIYHSSPDMDSVYLFVQWTAFYPDDNALSAFTNGDICLSVSADSGRTWTPPFNVTNTKTPDCAAGACLSEHWSSLAENMSQDGNLHIQYICDRDPAGAITPEGAWTDNPVMYLHLEQLPSEAHCGVTYSLIDPPSFYDPPVKVSPGGFRVVTLQLQGIYNIAGEYEVTCAHPNVEITRNDAGTLDPGETREVDATIDCPGGEEFVAANIVIRSCIGTEDEDTAQITLHAVCSEDDYYECMRDARTQIYKDNCKCSLWVCCNTEQRVWDKRYRDADGAAIQPIFTSGVTVATSFGGDLVVGRQDYADTRTYTRDTLRVVEGAIAPYPPNEPCILQKVHCTKTFICANNLTPPESMNHLRWWWVSINKQILMFHDLPPDECPNWKKEQIIKYIWIEWSDIPGWWPEQTPEGYENMYVGMFADVDAPFDETGNGYNTAGFEADLQLMWQHGFYDDTLSSGAHPEYDDYYVGLALTDPTGAIVPPLGAQNVTNEEYLYPQGGWGWVEDSLYKLLSTPGVNIHYPDSVADRSWVVTSSMIPAGTEHFDEEFYVIEAFIPGDEGTGLDQLRAHVIQTRDELLPELASYGVFSRDFPVCGDVTLDGKVLVNDAVFILGYLFGGGPGPDWPFTRGDPTGDGSVLVNDAVYILGYLFGGGPPCVNCAGFGR